MNLRSVDLNLLVVLDAVLDEAHVSRAARRIGLSQPAASAALERCRHLFSDRLLERVQGTMRPTPRGESLRRPVKDVLASVAAIVAPPAVDLLTVRQTVSLLMADVLVSLLMPELLADLRERSPGIDLVILPWQAAANATVALTQGDCDIAVSVLPKAETAIRRELLFEDSYRILMRRDHPAASCFNLDAWLAYPHVIVSRQGLAATKLDEQLERMERQRRIGLVVPSFSAVPPLLLRSDLIAMLPTRCLPKQQAKSFARFDLPIAVDGFAIHLAWHARSDSDPVIRHVASAIQTILA
ncbi:MAG TPA: LysR family transcriptional regulator [Mesorhizobium sp.]|uniref:LysR family transcriptional regulator n=1 Tax=Mesorhizobium sp. TaxID=1871066 RepID=UPI002DDCB319|nr:LysR family transcriptional regulator [Mesorhizobium sp.]HEV2503643.1 LysR family transcriptional regulator [Mesorhizobium sp.]